MTWYLNAASNMVKESQLLSEENFHVFNQQMKLINNRFIEMEAEYRNESSLSDLSMSLSFFMLYAFNKRLEHIKSDPLLIKRATVSELLIIFIMSTIVAFKVSVDDEIDVPIFMSDFCKKFEFYSKNQLRRMNLSEIEHLKILDYRVYPPNLDYSVYVSLCEKYCSFEDFEEINHSLESGDYYDTDVFKELFAKHDHSFDELYKEFQAVKINNTSSIGMFSKISKQEKLENIQKQVCHLADIGKIGVEHISQCVEISESVNSGYGLKLRAKMADIFPDIKINTRYEYKIVRNGLTTQI